MSLPRPRRFLQIHSSYVVEEVEGGLRVVDQHALHERILLDRLRGELRRGRLESQGALIPIPIRLGAGEVAVALDRTDEIGRLGYRIEEFGEEDLIVRAFPALLDGAPHVEVIRGIVARLESRGKGKVDEEILDDVLRRMACRGAVKAGTRLRDDEIEALLDQEEGVTGSFACAHGRPTQLVLSLADLERQFGRK